MIKVLFNVVGNRRMIFISLFIVITCGVGIGVLSILNRKEEFAIYDQKASTASENNVSPVEYMRIPLHDWELSYRVPEQSEQYHTIEKKRIFGGIVPHHLAAQSFIAEMFNSLSNRKNIPKTVVILSPNHSESGLSFIQTANMAWETPDGFIGTDLTKAQEIASTFETPLQNEGMRKEHGIYNILPFVKHFLPKANIVPITLRFSTPKSDQDHLVELLSKWLRQGDDVVVIASIDFSHYLSSEEAKYKDDETYAAMQSYDYAEIATYRSDHLDTPAGLIVLLQTMQLIGADNQTVLRYDNSGETFNQPFTQTTSHFLTVFTRKD